jgi:hypothetical protein
MKRSILVLGALLLPSTVSLAVIDTNTNGLSDPWEKANNNGVLFPETYDPQADPDSDGWTNAEEAAAGTNPNNPNSPGGILRPDLAHIPAVMGTDGNGQPVIITPEAVSLSWTTIPGKRYRLYFTSDLSSLLPVGSAFTGTGTTVTYTFLTSVADARFWRVSITDIDSDGDGLSNHEEALSSSNPSRRDTDGDGVNDYDEIVLNQTTASTKSDLDSDGVPDDFEKDLARKLLAYKSDPSQWTSTEFAALSSGNLDSAHAYSGDGTSTLDLYGLLLGAASFPPADNALMIEMTSREISIDGSYDVIPPEEPQDPENPEDPEISNTLQRTRSTSQNGVTITEPIEQTEATAAAFSNYLGMADWHAISTPRSLPASMIELEAMPSVSEFWALDLLPSNYACQGSMVQNRFRYISTDPTHPAISKTFFYINSTRAIDDHSGYIGSITSAVPINVALPSGQFVSPYIHQTAPLTDGIRTLCHVVPVDVTWQTMDGWNNVEDHIDPWSKPIAGKRIFPDFEDPSKSEIRHKLQVIVKTSPSLAGKTVFVKAFDVDDSTAEDFDLDENGLPAVIDTNGKAGGDNLPDYLNTTLTGQFWNGSAWGGDTAQATVAANGEAKFIFRVGMQPGNNYRVVASLNDQSMFAGVQTTDSTLATYLGPEAAQTGNAPATPLLTVWRRLWVENDSMDCIPTDPPPNSYMRNDLSSDIENPLIEQASLNTSGTDTLFVLQPISDPSSFVQLDNGHIIVGNSNYGITGTGVVGEDHVVSVAGNHTTDTVGASYRLYDDDAYGLANIPLPRTDLVDDVMKRAFRPGFIEVMETGTFNTQKLVPFSRNHAPFVGSPLNYNYGVWDNALEPMLEGGENLWAATVVVGYQSKHEQDNDPNSEKNSLDGSTVGDSLYFNGLARISVIYSETIRDGLDSQFRENTIGNFEYERRLRLTAAHEIGHQPLYSLGNDHHLEDGLMQDGGHGGLGGNETPFSPLSLKRFRSVFKWRQKD